MSRLVHGDFVADSASWYLMTLTPAQFPLQDLGDVCLGYELDSTFYPVAGEWTDFSPTATWVPFVGELELRRTAAASLPWSRKMLTTRSIGDVESVDFTCFRFAPCAIGLVVRPLHICVTEPLF